MRRKCKRTIHCKRQVKHRMDKRILVIEDDPEINKLLHKILAKAAMNPVPAYSGTEGLLQLENNSYDLILLDLMLPGISGEELISKIREKSMIPIIVITAKVDIEDKVQDRKSVV